jgi:hypothetical protein
MIRLLLFLTVCHAAFAQRGQLPAVEPNSAIAAIRLLPKDAQKNLARIEARDGNPWPTRWYLLVHDAAEVRGLREFVVADGELKAGRSLSQFADGLTKAEVVGGDAVKLNSDDAVGFAAKFALANGVRLGTVNYELAKTGTPPAAAWRLTCYDPEGKLLGSVTLHATRKSFISQEGFAAVPPELVISQKSGDSRNAQRSKTTSPTANAPVAARPVVVPKPAPAPVRARPVATPTPKPGPIRRIFGA